jgi:hypothetical protein
MTLTSLVAIVRHPIQIKSSRHLKSNTQQKNITYIQACGENERMRVKGQAEEGEKGLEEEGEKGRRGVAEVLLNDRQSSSNGSDKRDEKKPIPIK